jgi:hypothetical protein
MLANEFSDEPPTCLFLDRFGADHGSVRVIGKRGSRTPGAGRNAYGDSGQALSLSIPAISRW